MAGCWTVTGLARMVLALAVAGTLAGCSGRPEGVLSPVAETVPGASRVDMLVATTRLDTDRPGVMFSGERRPKGLAFADVEISIPPDSARRIGDVQWPAALPGNPATDFVALKAHEIPESQAVALFHNALARVPKQRVLVFVHGFNNRFEDAVFRFAQIVHDSRAPVVPVLFTWPSRASVLAYGYDRESTNYSRDALEKVLQTLAQDPRVGEISVLAHSMGNWLTLESLRQMAIRNRVIAPKIKNVMLAAPDVDVDVFRTQIDEFGAVHPNFTLFVSQDDRALAVSRRVWGSTARLGAIDPEQEPYKTELARRNIKVLDLTKLRAGDQLNHGKFAESPEVVQLIGQRLVEGQTVTDSRIGVGDRIAQVTVSAASAVGSAAGLVLSAPAAVVDSDSRANYNDQMKTLAETLADTADAGTKVLSSKPTDADQ
jgi:esterase/lipase superfamily enzyme